MKIIKNKADNKMNVTIVKHENCGIKYVFLVPEDKTLKAGI